jgi:hypothetical protein
LIHLAVAFVSGERRKFAITAEITSSVGKAIYSLFIEARTVLAQVI